MINKLKIIVSLLLFLTPTLCFAKTIKVDRTYYDVDDILELDGLKYDAINDELTIENGNFISIHSENDLNINVIGENNFNNDRSMSSCIKGKNIKISGDGILNLTSNSGGISANNLEVNDTNINFSVKTTAIILFGDNQNLIFNNSSIKSNSLNDNFYLNGNIKLNNTNIEIESGNLLNGNSIVYLDNSKGIIHLTKTFDLSKISLINNTLLFSIDSESYHEDYEELDNYLKIEIKEDLLDENNIESNSNMETDSTSDSSNIDENNLEENGDLLVVDDSESLEEIDEIFEPSIEIYNISNEIEPEVKKSNEINNNNIVNDNNLIKEEDDNKKDNINTKEVPHDILKKSNKSTKVVSNPINSFKKYFSLFISYISGIIIYLFTKRRVHG